jgi:hypothetical protein
LIAIIKENRKRHRSIRYDGYDSLVNYCCNVLLNMRHGFGEDGLLKCLCFAACKQHIPTVLK